MLRTPRRAEIVDALRDSVSEVFSSVMISFREQVKNHTAGTGTASELEAAELHTCISIQIEGELDATVILRCDASGAADIAHGLLMLGPDETLAMEEIDDALGECANLIVGKVKTDLLDPIGAFRLGLPHKVDTQLRQPWQPAGHQIYQLKEGVISIELWCDHLEDDAPHPTTSAAGDAPSAPGAAVVKSVQAIQTSVCDVLSMVAERTLEFGPPLLERSRAIPATPAAIYISYRLSFTSGGETRPGALLLPLPESIALACYLMMVPEEAVAGRRSDQHLDRTTMDAMLEIGNFIGGAVDSALRSILPGGPKVQAAGCQGVRPSRAPVLRGHQGELWVARFDVALNEQAAAQGLLLLPASIFPAG